MLARAMVRDLFARTRAAQMLSTLTIVMAIAPIIGPLMGGQMIRVTSWHAIFWLLAGIGLVMLLALRWLPETLPPERRQQGSPLKAFHHYGQLLRNRIFMRYTLSLTCYYVAAYAFITGSPDVYIRYFGVEPQHYGWLFAVNILGVMTMSTVNRRLVQRYALGICSKRRWLWPLWRWRRWRSASNCITAVSLESPCACFSFLHERRDCRHLNGGSAG